MNGGKKRRAENIPLYKSRKNHAFVTLFSKIFSENLKNQRFLQN